MSRGRYDSVNDVLIPTAGNGGGSQITVDDAISSTSENPVQNKVIYAYIDTMITQSINASY